jgi:hypothetical protein
MLALLRATSVHPARRLRRHLPRANALYPFAAGVALAGIPLGGVDVSYTRGAFYPGVFDFAAELACSAAGRGQSPLPVAVLTARARELRAFLEIKQTDKICVGFRARGAARGHPEWGIGPVLYGSVQEWICQERKGWRKFENFKLLRASSDASRRTRYLFVGDNGSSEKDLEAAQLIVSEAQRAVDAVFLHAVSADEQPAPMPDDHEYRGVPVRYFRTYATAAAKANRLGLLSGKAARRVVDAAEADMLADGRNLAPGSANERLLRDEIAAARAAIGGWHLAKPLGPLRRRLRPLAPTTA